MQTKAVGVTKSNRTVRALTVADSLEFQKYELLPGLTYYSSVLAPSEQAILLKQTEAMPWDTTLKRKTQQYGYTYNYRDPNAPLDPAPPFPVFTVPLLARLRGLGIAEPFGQLIVNHYTPGQGIGAHIDHMKHFGNVIAIFSAGSHAEMVFKKVKGEARPAVKILLEPGSLLVMQDEARKQWKHSILARTSDYMIPRKERISYTFRCVKY